MRYKETREQSAELLRMVLPLMARHSAGFHPLTYAVWYEYVAGTNPRLRAAVDSRLVQRPLLTDADITQLFDAHVALRDIESSARMRAEIARLVDEVDDATEDADHGVQHFGNELEDYRAQLQPHIGAEQLNQVVTSLLDETTRVKVKTEVFQQHLRKSSQEVERLREELEVVQGLALTDPLTELLNRRGFDQQVTRLCTGGMRSCAVLVLDIDHFKAINDAHGHLLGDKVIIAVANVLRGCVGPRGHIARIGGEEFAVLMPQTSAAGGAELAERIRGAVERGRLRRAESEQQIGSVTVSIGVATIAEGEPFEQTFDRADRALYQSKTAGRNRVSIAERPSADPADGVDGAEGIDPPPAVA